MFNKNDLTDADVEIWNMAIESAARSIEEFHTNNVGMIHPIAIADAKRIRNLKVND